VKILVTSDSRVCTGDAIADAVVDYSLALTRLQAIDVVRIPVRDEDGGERTVEFVIGWNMPVVAVPESTAADELIDADALGALVERATATERRRGEPFDDADLAPELWPEFE
jgi:hypothetical protein